MEYWTNNFMANNSLIVPAAQNYFGLKGIIVYQDIFDYYSIVVEVNLELRGFTIFTKSSLPLQSWVTGIYSIYEEFLTTTVLS